MLDNKLDLQLFTDGDGEPLENQGDNTPNGNQNQENGNQEPKQTESNDQEPAGNEPKPKGNLPRTQEELDAIIQERLARDRKSRKNNDSKTLEDRLTKLEEENTLSKFENTALKRGVKEENLARVIKLARLEETDDVAEAVENVLKDFPIFVSDEVTISTGTKVKTEPQQNELEDRERAFRERMGLPVDK